MRKLRKFHTALLEDLKDPEYAKTYLSIALEEHQKNKDEVAFLTALRDIAEAQGGLAKLAKKTDLNRQNLYKALSAKGKPKFDTVETLLQGIGFRFSVERIEPLKR